ncbi:CsbD family protein [Ruegeria atlantica]|uniref:CsbD family protein n=1 Tax=Ruegeria atlantica TaxID=81569 RepID=A0AA91BTI4_9RHOB|nr:CsbD family protein [Ruegeria atlantica]NOE20787.1 CsbD family protein [Ruegeria atlantica]
MNWDDIQDQWETLKGRVQAEWSELSHDEIDQIAGKREKLVEIIHQKYGRSRSDVEKEVDEFLSSE